jgi:hypothetical protein
VKLDLSGLVDTGILDFLNHTAFHVADVHASYDPVTKTLHLDALPDAKATLGTAAVTPSPAQVSKGAQMLNAIAATAS